MLGGHWRQSSPPLIEAGLCAQREPLGKAALLHLALLLRPLAGQHALLAPLADVFAVLCRHGHVALGVDFDGGREAQ